MYLSRYSVSTTACLRAPCNKSLILNNNKKKTTEGYMMKAIMMQVRDNGSPNHFVALSLSIAYWYDI